MTNEQTTRGQKLFRTAAMILMLLAGGSIVVGARNLAKADAAPATVWNGVFGKDQSKRGEAAYMANCATCHQEDLGGKEPAPELAGPTFMSHWDNHSVLDLFTRVSTTMPQGKPGSLSPDAYTDVIAFLLDANGFPSGAADLKRDNDALKKVTILATKPH